MARDDKPTRILDAAEQLLVSYGYRKVTIDEVAARAKVGKGTVYLSWPSKRELFAAVLTRESLALLTEQIATLRADPAEVQLHRAMRHVYLQSMRRPLSRALSTADRTVLGELLEDNDTGARLAAGKIGTTEQSLAILYANGLLRDDPARDPMLTYRLSAAVLGWFLLDGMQNVGGQNVGEQNVGEQSVGEHEREARADALALTVHRAFEPAARPAKPALRAAATDMIALFEQWATELTAALPAGGS